VQLVEGCYDKPALGEPYGLRVGVILWQGIALAEPAVVRKERPGFDDRTSSFRRARKEPGQRTNTASLASEPGQRTNTASLASVPGPFASCRRLWRPSWPELVEGSAIDQGVVNRLSGTPPL
jgi:hypothetical protein